MTIRPFLRLREGAQGLVAPVVLLVALGCAQGPGGPRFTATWTGSDTNEIAASPTTIWCPVAKRLEVKAAREDMGFGLVLYPRGELAAGNYPGFDPGVDSIHRPGVSGAARWYTELAIIGYQSDSGSASLTRSGDRVGVSFGFRMRSLNGLDTIRARGQATGLRPGPCRADSVPNSSPTQ